MNRRILFGVVCGLLLASAAFAQNTSTNPPVGSVWTYLGPTFGAAWVPAPGVDITTPPSFLVSPVGNPPQTLTSFNVYTNSASVTTREYLANIGFTVGTGMGVADFNADKVGLYVGNQAVAGAGELWAVNFTTYLTPTYNGTSAHHQVEELDMITDANAGYVDPRPGPNGISYPGHPVAAPRVVTNAQTLSSSAVLNFGGGVLPASLAVGNTVRDITHPAAITGNTYITGFTGTTATMNVNAAATVAAGDTIEFKSLYTYGTVLESVGNNNTAALIVGGSSAWYRGVGCDQTNAAFYSCFFDYSTSQAALDIWGVHSFGVDMFNANISALVPIRLPNGYGFIGDGSWQNASPAGDTGIEIKSGGTSTPDWILQSNVSVSPTGRFRIYDNLFAVESVSVLQNGLGLKMLGELYMMKTAFGASAPGVNQFKLGVVAGTNAGTCKLIAYGGTSATPTTVIDNVGAGC